MLRRGTEFGFIGVSMSVYEDYGLSFNLFPKQLLMFSHPDMVPAGYEIPGEVLFGGAAGGGKALLRGETVMTPFGPKLIEDMKVGSTVIGMDGKSSKVIDMTPWEYYPSYKVSFNDGTSVSVSEGHLWAYWGTNHKSKKYKSAKEEGHADFLSHCKVGSTKYLKEILDKFESSTRKDSEGYIRKNHIKIPITEPVSFTKPYHGNVRPIPPYVLGVLLGDGYIDEARVNISYKLPGETKEILNYFNEDGFHGFQLAKDESLQISGVDFEKLKKNLTFLGLMNSRSATKFIPEYYKLAPIEDRYRLIQGLMDTDGYAGDSTDCAGTYASISEDLAKDVLWVLRSLGCYASITYKPDVFYRDINGEKVRCKPAWIVNFSAPDESKLFRMQRKKDVCKEYSCGRNFYGKVITSIEEIGVQECRCITVDNPYGLYLTNDFTVTHNSYSMRAMSIILALECPGVNIYLFRKTYTELKTNHLLGPSGFQAMLATAVQRKLVRIDSQNNIIQFKNGPSGSFAGGSIIYLRHVQYEKDVYIYQGAEIHVLMIDEATHFSEPIYNFLRGRVRLGSWFPPAKWKNWFPRIICASNPGCVPYGDVLTTDGWKQIKDVLVGDDVYCLNPENGKVVQSTVTDNFCYTSYDEMYHVKTEDIDLDCTGDHRLAISYEGKLQMMKLNELEYLDGVCYLVAGEDGSKRLSFTAADISKSSFDGFVHDLQVEEYHNFVFRQNGKVIISGNSTYHNFWKHMFVDFVDKDNIYRPKRASIEEGGMLRQYIPATVYDNPALLKEDPGYVDRLRGLGSPELVKAMLEGNWDIVSGGMFDDLWRRDIHVIEPFKIPKGWYINRCFDWGSSKPFAVLWVAESNGEPVEYEDGTFYKFPSGTLFVIDEWYGNNKKAKDPNTGLFMTNSDIGAKIKYHEENNTVLAPVSARINPGPADNSIYTVINNVSQAAGINSGFWGTVGRSHSDIFFPSDKSPGSRVKRWSLIRDRLACSHDIKLDKPMERPGLFIFNVCNDLIRTLPTAPRDDKNMEDIDTDSEDHLLDALGYRVLQARAGVGRLGVRLG